MGKAGLRKMPSCLQIAKHWLKHARGIECDVIDCFGSSPAELICCWRCGWGAGNTAGLERAHITASRISEFHDPINLLLLCHTCHRQQPDGADRNEQLNWVLNGAWSEIVVGRNLLEASMGKSVEELIDVLMKLHENDKELVMLHWRKMLSEASQITAANTYSNTIANLGILARRTIASHNLRQPELPPVSGL